jgi:alkanesulfonate monooxygenase SsuD/methylene tetrahydromethanopterin reductase-like flavin-dependent oxidoreductase (luciferase family)
MAIKYSILDLATIVKGDDINTTFEKSVKSAQLAEKLGFTRYWFSEHHNFPNVASASTSILIGHIASQTQSIRVGSGGIMLRIIPLCPLQNSLELWTDYFPAE